MVETQSLLGKITALRQRLEQAQGLVKEAGSAAVALLNQTESVALLEKQVATGSDHDIALDSIVRPVAPSAKAEQRPGPRQLTSRSRRLLEKGRELLGRLRLLADAFSPAGSPEPTHGDLRMVPLLDRAEPLAVLYRETAAMANTALRIVALFPDTATAQLQMCEGLEGVLVAVGERLLTLETGVARHRREQEQLTRLADLFTAALAGDKCDPQVCVDFAAEILTDAVEGGPLRFVGADAAHSARFAAAHGINTARVLARLVRHDTEWKQRPLDAVLAALIHDSGMVNVPAEILLQPQALDDDQRRTIEAHCHASAELAAALWPDSSWLAATVTAHHERLDGTGYPAGLREGQIPSLARLLAVADVYVALCSDRSYRPARSTRTALTDTLLLAEQGLLDRKRAESLLQLSFYPVGTAVEMADGSVGVVAAVPSTWRDLNSPARPVVAVLLDADDRPYAAPRHLDLLQCEHHSILRSLPARERRERLGKRFPEWA